MAFRLSKGEQFIIDENRDLSMGAFPDWSEKIFKVFPSLTSRNYRLYFSGQLVSLVGKWLQIVAEGWLVLELTNSPFLIGLVAAAATLPTLLFSLFGGVIIDRMPKKSILLFTQTASMILALIYGGLAIFHLINIVEIIVLAFLLGTVNSLDIPARQAFAIELVEKDHLASAISLNSGAFNAARIIGPSIAGLLIGLFGTGWAFIINGLSYIAALTALLRMQVKEKVTTEHAHPIRAIKEGLVYSFSHPILRTLLTFSAVLSIFGWSYSTVMPYIAKNVFHLGATGLGTMYAVSGLGALGAMFLISLYSKKVSPLTFIIGGNTLFAISLGLFTFTHTLVLALPLLFFAGLGLLLVFSMLNTTIQTLVNNKLRGRVMSIYAITFIGLFPLGNIEVGALTQRFGPGIAIRFGTAIVFLFGLLVYFSRNQIRSAHARYSRTH